MKPSQIRQDKARWAQIRQSGIRQNHGVGWDSIWGEVRRTKDDRGGKEKRRGERGEYSSPRTCLSAETLQREEIEKGVFWREFRYEIDCYGSDLHLLRKRDGTRAASSPIAGGEKSLGLVGE